MLRNDYSLGEWAGEARERRIASEARRRRSPRRFTWIGLAGLLGWLVIAASIYASIRWLV